MLATAVMAPSVGAFKELKNTGSTGFYTINEEKVADLSAETLHLMNRNGYLMPMFMVMASTVNVQALVEKRNARLSD